MSLARGVRTMRQGEAAWMEAAAFAATGLVAHAFCTRQGGIAAVLEAWGRPAARLAMVHQVHGNDLVRVDSGVDTAALALTPADGLLTDCASVLLGVRTADCVPLLLLDPRRPAVAAVHAGWRGTVQRIAGKAVETMAAEFGTVPKELLAAIGPCIGPCCYEVDRMVWEPLARAFPEVWRRFVTPAGGDRVRLDLRAAIRHDLEERGVPSENVTVVEACTFCQPELFPSFRREGAAAGRIIAVIGLREGRECRAGEPRREEACGGARLQAEPGAPA